MEITKSKSFLNIFPQTAIFFEHYFFYYDFLKFVRIYAAPGIYIVFESFFIIIILESWINGVTKGTILWGCKYPQGKHVQQSQLTSEEFCHESRH